MPRYAATRILPLLSTLLGCAMVQAKGLDSTGQRIVRAADARQAHSSGIFREERGFGALGDEAHAPGEYLGIDAMAVQVRRAALLFHRLKL